MGAKRSPRAASRTPQRNTERPVKGNPILRPDTSQQSTDLLVSSCEQVRAVVDGGAGARASCHEDARPPSTLRFSTSVTRMPREASRVAQAKPATPPPTTITSVEEGSPARSVSRKLRLTPRGEDRPDHLPALDPDALHRKGGRGLESVVETPVDPLHAAGRGQLPARGPRQKAVEAVGLLEPVCGALTMSFEQMCDGTGGGLPALRRLGELRRRQVERVEIGARKVDASPREVLPRVAKDVGALQRNSQRAPEIARVVTLEDRECKPAGCSGNALAVPRHPVL